MKLRIVLTTIAGLLLSTTVWAAVNLNSSKSNAYRLTYPTDLVTTAQAKAILTELDAMGEFDQSKLKRWLSANFKRFGVNGARVKAIIVMPRDKELKEIGIIVLTDRRDEAQARATTIKGSKSNTSD